MWRERIERCLSSGMTNSEWCRLNKVAPSTLYSWIAKFRKEEAALFAECNTSEWIEITKQGLATNVALAPVATKEEKIEANAGAEKTAYAPDRSTPIIYARLNGVELSITPGSEQTDIDAVFKAAISL